MIGYKTSILYERIVDRLGESTHMQKRWDYSPWPVGWTVLRPLHDTYRSVEPSRPLGLVQRYAFPESRRVQYQRGVEALLSSLLD